MKSETIMSALSGVDDKLIRNARVSQKTRSSRWVRWGSAAACFAVLLAAALIRWRGGAVTQPVAPAVSDGSIQNTISISGDSRPSISMSKIFVNELSEYQPDVSRLWRDPALYDEVVWDHGEITAYYGKELSPAYIPEGLTASSYNGTARVCIQKDGTVAEDMVWLGFYQEYQEDGGPKYTEDVAAYKGFSIQASKLGILDCGIYLLPENVVKASDFGGTAVTIGYRSMPYGPYAPETHQPAGYYDLYVAEFEFEDIEYKIVAEQMELEELVQVVASIIYDESDFVIEK